MHDWRGTYIKPGSKVLYSTRHSSSMDQHIGVVKEVVVVKDGYGRYAREVEKARVLVTASTATWSKLPRNVMVSTANLTVIGEV